MAKRPDLIILDGEMKGRRFVVGPGPLRLGRSSSNDIHIPDEELSRNHCLFECLGETGIRLTDLASANGTYVNGHMLGSDPVELKEGDIVKAGNLRICVGENRRAGSSADKPVDLGLGSASGGRPDAASSPRRAPLASILWMLAILIAASSIAFILFMPVGRKQSAAVVRSAEKKPIIHEIAYEKIKADSKGIFRYALKYNDQDGLAVILDDTANNRRMPIESRRLSKAEQAELGEILPWKALTDIAGDYTGIEPDPPALESIVLKVVYTTGICRISVVNTTPPPAFEQIYKRLEAFSQVQLGVTAIAYAREELIRRAEEATVIGDAKWEERDVDYGNLAESIRAYQEAIHYLKTVNPKPECAEKARKGLAAAIAEQSKRCQDHTVNYEKEISLHNWEAARMELRIVLQIVPNREDARHRTASEKLLEVENIMKREGGRR